MDNRPSTPWLTWIGVLGITLCLLVALVFKTLAPLLVSALYSQRLPDPGILRGKNVYRLDFYLYRLDQFFSQTLSILLIFTGAICALLIVVELLWRRHPRSTRSINLLLLTISGLATLLSGEILLRFFGHYPAQSLPAYNWTAKAAQSIAPFPLQPHEKLGWVNSSGSYLDFLFDFAQELHQITVDERGNRITSQERSLGGERILITGCSATFGSCVNDSETFPFLLQNVLSENEVVNLGVAAYSTYQSLLRTKEYLASYSGTVSAIVYPFFDDHLIRNVASSDWRSRVLFRLSSQNLPRIPYARLRADSGGELVTGIMPPDTTYVLANYSSIVQLAFTVMRQLLSTDPAEQAIQEAAIQLLKEFDHLADEHGARFFVVDFFTPSILNPERPQRKKLQQMGIRVIDCPLPLYDPMYMIPVDGHPNQRAHAYWADCLTRELQKALRETYEGRLSR